MLGKAHSEAVREIERKEGEAYRSGMEGSEERAWRAARTNGRSTVYHLPIDRYSRLSVWEERMELVRELDGEQAYEKMRRAVERASQPVEPLSHVPSRSGPGRDGARTRWSGAGTTAPAAEPVGVREDVPGGLLCVEWIRRRGRGSHDGAHLKAAKSE